jgi:16S rRNA (cytosine967-C5)-methyltransferase
MTDTAALVLAPGGPRAGSVAFAGRSADAALEQVSASGSNRSAIRAITLGSLRWYWRLDALASALPGSASLVPASASTAGGLAPSARVFPQSPRGTVSSAVDAVRTLGQPRATGLMNALLRRFLRERDRLIAAVR